MTGHGHLVGAVPPRHSRHRSKIAPLLALGCCLTVAATSPATAADFDACLKTLQARARGEGIAEPIVRDVLPHLQRQPRVLELDRQQPEFSQTLAAYLNARAGERRVAQGRRLFREQRPFLAALTHRYGVPGHYLIALWGLETGYGSYLGTMPTLDSLATLACDSRRGAFFAGELWDALRLLERHGLRADDMRGSWAGAVGHTQFLPSSYLRYAVDGDGDGRIDLWRSHRDALASGAHLLQALGWRAGERWGREVMLPDDFPFEYTGHDTRRSVAQWAVLGVQSANGAPLPESELEGSILVPAGHRGPAFLAYGNFTAIMRWNQSEFYALSVGHVADRIAGGGALRNPPPTDQKPLSRTQTMALQERLLADGYLRGAVDGLLGPVTRSALSAWQRDAGLIDDGFPDAHSLQRLGIHAPD